MRIALDLQGAQTESRFRGIGRYCLAHTKAMIEAGGEHDFYLILNGAFGDSVQAIREDFADLLPQANILVWDSPQPVMAQQAGNEWRRAAAQAIREAFLAQLEPDLVHVASLFEGFADNAAVSIGRHFPELVTSATLYDLIPLIFAENYLEPNEAYKSFYLEKLADLQRASGFLAISACSRQDAIEHLQLAPDRIANVGAGVDPVFRPLGIADSERRALLAKLGIKGDFVLYTGGVDQRKNLPLLIQAYARLPSRIRETYQLVLVGRVPAGDAIALRESVSDSALAANRVVLPGYVSEAELVALYNLTSLFVFPSIYEGFGLPVLEAVRCGAPVLGARSSSIVEILDDDAALFDPKDVTALGRKMRRALTESQFRKRLKDRQAATCERFTWARTGEASVAALERFGAEGAGGAGKNLAGFVAGFAAQQARWPGSPSQRDLRRCAVAIDLGGIGSSCSRKRLFVDVSELVHRDARTGVQRVTRSILGELLSSPPTGFEVRPVYATAETPGYRYANRFLAGTLGVTTATDVDDEPISFRNGDVFLGLDLQHHVVPAQRSYLALMRSYGVEVHFVIYDLLPIWFPEAFPEGTREGHEVWLRAVTAGDGVICISRAVADELNRWLDDAGVDTSPRFAVRWFHLGSDFSKADPTRGLPDDWARIAESLEHHLTFLMVGTVEPRKGHSQVLDAFEQLWEQGVDVVLAIVGKGGWHVEPLLERLRSHPERGARLFFFEGASDECLERLYGIADCLVAASRGEGFGLPLVEAAEHGLPIIARDIPVFREVAEDSAFFFSGDSGATLAEAIQRWRSEYQAGEHPRSEHMRRLSWSVSARELLSAMALGS